MGIHGDDVVRTIREALADRDIAPTQSEVRMTPNPEREGWANRDGTLRFDCIGRDWFRAFRVTVEVLPSTDAFKGEMGSDEWVVAPPAESAS